ncbi:deoxyhypusine hydroxylase [Hamiltosporidium magnivora]|uniref:Deoxyhypusine hydroxylase n=1 Tax=Hamiltosporidium magnivora TaxID=148818 RepID=A0A4Q9LG74_9MICR|nr:deoxyhypusine hydroxylase [Hamiltosporidium magnivora]
MLEINKARDILNGKHYNISQKMRALFFLRNINNTESVLSIMSAFHNESVLLKHELAYVLGQMRDPTCIQTLKDVLSNTAENEIVRHEAAEALGNFLDKNDIDFLKSFLKDISIPHSDIYLRYGAMFSLRNKKNISILVKGFKDNSALFRHEVAFVLGQLKMKESILYLKEVLDNENEHDMVRHECAEAIGAIGTDECHKILMKYLNCDADIVRESAEVALDICAYEMSTETEYCKV